MGNRSFFDGPHGFTGDAVKNVGEGLLARLGDGFDRAAVDRDIKQIPCGWKIVVPETVMDSLEMPNSFACFCVDANEAFGKEVIAGAHATVPVIGWCTGRKVDVAKFFIDRHGAPHVRVAAVSPRLVVPAVCAEFVSLRDCVKDPLHLTRSRVKPTDVSRVSFSILKVRILDDAPDNHGISGNS